MLISESFDALIVDNLMSYSIKIHVHLGWVEGYISMSTRIDDNTPIITRETLIDGMVICMYCFINKRIK